MSADKIRRSCDLQMSCFIFSINLPVGRYESHTTSQTKHMCVFIYIYNVM